jgi:hypothetical protein
VNGLATGLEWQNMQTGSGNAYATATNPSTTDDNCAHLTGFAADHFIEGVVHRAGGYSPIDPHEIELLLRLEITSNNVRGYEVLLNSDGGSDLIRWNGGLGAFTVLSWTGSGAGGVANGDVFKAQMIGTTITVFKNTVQIMTVSDATFATGNPGIGSFMRGNGNVLASMGWQSIVAGNL